MSTAFTPGPWTWFVHGETIHGMQMKYLKGSDGQGFAHTVGLSEPTDTANAHLMAAAPDLLTVVMGCATTFRHYESLHTAKGSNDGRLKAQVNADMAKLCENVIAKATGGQP